MIIEEEKTPRGNMEDPELLDMLQSLTLAGPEAIKCRVSILRNIAGMARGNAVARRLIVHWLEAVAPRLPDEANTFRAYYLDEQRQSARQICRRLCMDISTVHRHKRRVFEAMCAPAFGLYGIFLADSELEKLEYWEG